MCGRETLNKTFKRQDNVVCRSIAGETILVPIHGTLADMQQIFILNEVAECIWSALDGTRSLREVRDLVVETFDVGACQAEEEIMEFVDSLVQNHLIMGGG